jgi:hypothetical protein
MWAIARGFAAASEAAIELRIGRDVCCGPTAGSRMTRAAPAAPVGRHRRRDLTLGAAHALSVPLIGSGHWGTQYDVSPDTQHVYFIDRSPAPRPSDIRLVIGWQAFLK